MLPREHRVSCQGVKMFLLKDPFNFFFLSNKLIFVKVQVLTQFEKGLSQFQFWSFVTI